MMTRVEWRYRGKLYEVEVEQDARRTVDAALAAVHGGRAFPASGPGAVGERTPGRATGPCCPGRRDRPARPGRGDPGRPPKEGKAFGGDGYGDGFGGGYGDGFGGAAAAAMRRCLGEVVARCSTWHSPADARLPKAEARVREKREMGGRTGAGRGVRHAAGD